MHKNTVFYGHGSGGPRNQISDRLGNALRASGGPAVVSDLHQLEPFGGGPPDLDADRLSRFFVPRLDSEDKSTDGDSKNSPHETGYRVFSNVTFRMNWAACHACTH